MVKKLWRRSRRGRANIARREAGAGDDCLDVGGPHLGLTTTDGGHFRFSEIFNSAALFQGVENSLKLQIGQNSRARGNRRTGTLKSARQTLNRGGFVGAIKCVSRKSGRWIVFCW